MFILLFFITDASSNHENRISALEQSGGGEKETLVYEQTFNNIRTNQSQESFYVAQYLQFNFAELYNAVKGSKAIVIKISDINLNITRYAGSKDNYVMIGWQISSSTFSYLAWIDSTVSSYENYVISKYRIFPESYNGHVYEKDLYIYTSDSSNSGVKYYCMKFSDSSIGCYMRGNNSGSAGQMGVAFTNCSDGSNISFTIKFYKVS